MQGKGEESWFNISSTPAGSVFLGKFESWTISYKKKI